MRIPEFNTFGPSNPVTEWSGKVSQEFNEFCLEVGLQARLTLDTRDWQGTYVLENIGKRLIRLRTPEQTVYIHPGTGWKVKIDDVLGLMDYTDYV